MAETDCDIYIPFDDGAGSDVLEDGWRLMARNYLIDGPVRLLLNSLLVTTDTGRNVLLSSGYAAIQGHLGGILTDKVVPIAVNGSGNPRIDRIVMRARFTDNKIVFDVLQGTPAGSPAAPALTQNTTIWEISLAQVDVAAGFSSLGAGTIHDERRWAAGRPPGGPFLIACAAQLTTSLPTNSGDTEILFFGGTEQYDTAGIHSTSSNSERFTIPGGCAGLWRFTVLVAWEPNAVNDRSVSIYKNGSVLRNGPVVPATGVSAGESVIGWDYEDMFAVGDYIEWRCSQNSGSDLDVVYSRATARYLGSLAA